MLSGCRIQRPVDRFGENLGTRGSVDFAPALVLRADAALAKPAIYEALKERGARYAIRIPADSLECDIAELLTRLWGRPSRWKASRRVVARGSIIAAVFDCQKGNVFIDC